VNHDLEIKRFDLGFPGHSIKHSGFGVNSSGAFSAAKLAEFTIKPDFFRQNPAIAAKWPFPTT
jgi:hypothetical protein